MNQTDPNGLEARYAAMATEELLRLKESGGLTDEASDLLERALHKRLHDAPHIGDDAPELNSDKSQQKSPLLPGCRGQAGCLPVGGAFLAGLIATTLTYMSGMSLKTGGPISRIAVGLVVFLVVWRLLVRLFPSPEKG